MRLARWIAGGFGAGFAPVAPGTLASAVATLVGALLMWWSPYALPAAILLVAFGGWWAIREVPVEGDPGWVVIDEFAGQFVALLGLRLITPWGLLLAFVLFRFFDITKLGPVGWADRRHDAAGIMADDLIAGAIAAAILWFIRACWGGALL
jgi:phosphatidylglycerophosphatase A